MSWGKPNQPIHKNREQILGQHKATMKVLDLPFIPTDICNVQDQTILVLICTLVKLLETLNPSE